MKVSEAKQWAASTCLLLLSIGMLAVPAFAQTTTGSIYGTVTDITGAVIPNAQVTVTHVRTGEVHTASSNSSGNYTFPALVPGEYKATAQVAGFQIQTQSDIRLDANQSVHVNFSLQPGTTKQSVTVQAGTTLVDTRQSVVGHTVDQERMQDLPLNGRDAYDLVQIVPGVTNYAADTATGSRQGTQFSDNGLPTSNTAYYLDGAYDSQLWRFGGSLIPNPDALEEFRVLTSNYDAEFGRSPGGVVNVITRSGTNQFHGLVYDYLRNDALNARNYFNTAVTPLRQNQFGANFGGPIVHDKAFFFLSYQGFRIRTPVTIPSAALVTPTPQEAKGNFSAQPASRWPKQENGVYYSCNGVKGVICSNLLDPVAQNLLKFVPLSNPATGHPPQQNANGDINADQGLAKMDYDVTSKHRLSAMYFMSRGTSNTPNANGNEIFDYAGMVDYEGQYNAVAGDTWMISPTKLNDLRVFFSKNHYIIANKFGTQHLLASLGSQMAEGGNLNAVPYFSITGYWSMGTNNGGPNDLPTVATGVSDTFNWMRGNQDIKAGGSFIWDRMVSVGGGSSNGIFTFTGSTTGNALADFLLGNANSLKQNNGVDFHVHSPDPSLFIQDNWKLTRRLALNLGVRWELFPPWTGQNDVGTFVPNVQSKRFPTAPLGLLTSGDPGIPDGIRHTPWDTFAPRVGFAYDVFGNGATAIRGGYGLFYVAEDQVQNQDLLVQQPFSRTITISKTPNLVTPYAPGPDPFPYTPNPQNAVFLSGATIYSLPPNSWTVPYVHEYNLNVQHQFGATWSAQVGYVGNTTPNLYIHYDENSPIYAPGGKTNTAGLNARRPYQPTPATYTFGAIILENPAQKSWYNSLQATLTHRFAHHFSLLASYVWSKDLAYGTLVNAYDLASSKGLSDYDLPQRFVASYIWDTPQVRRWGFLGKQVLSGWQLNGITTLSTGGPFNVTSGVDTNLDGTNNDRPNVIGNPALAGDRSRAEKIQEFFNTAAFVHLPAGVPYGNAPYNMLIGPGYVNTDFSLFKTFPVWRETTLQFRAEFFNLFNNVNLVHPNGVMTSPNFGKITTAGSPRIVQFALRYSF